jgi:hypothetical protein
MSPARTSAPQAGRARRQPEKSGGPKWGISCYRCLLSAAGGSYPCLRHIILTTIDDLRKAIADLPDEMKVEIAEGVGITATTVRELRALGSFPSGHEKLRIVTPRERYPESVVRIELPD